MERDDYTVACTDFSNVDDYDRRVIVMQPTDDIAKRKKRYLLEFDGYGQAQLIATIPAQ